MNLHYKENNFGKITFLKMKLQEALIVNLYVFFILFCSCKQEIIKTIFYGKITI